MIYWQREREQSLVLGHCCPVTFNRLSPNAMGIKESPEQSLEVTQKVSLLDNKVYPSSLWPTTRAIILWLLLMK